MALNLKHIAYTDADNLKLDKVNYNFDQLVANGGGPQGFQGSTGEQGFQGITGYQGNQGIEGPQGVQGPQGNNGADIWKVNAGNGANLLNTLVPQHDDSERPEAPSVVFGYKSNQAEYDQVEENSQIVVNRSGQYQHNLELRSIGVGNKFYFTLDLNEDGLARLSQRFENSGGVYDLYADKFTWFTVDNNQFIDKITLDNQGFRVNIDTLLSDTKVEGDLQITSGNPGLNKIAVSGDTNGTLEFRTVEELGGVVPVGTIVSVDPAFVTSDKFITEQIDTFEDETTGLLHVTAGRGIGSFVGWYICNGKTWTDGTVSYATPNLNSFSYSIQQGGTQNGVSGTDNAIALIGGADIETTGTYDGTDWNVTMTTNSASSSIGQGSAGTPLTIKRLPQIIYLGASNLYWSQDGPSLPNFAFSDWTGTVSVSAGGAITITNGNSPNASTEDANFAPNTDPGNRSVIVNVSVEVPQGPYGNVGAIITGTRAVTQPTSYTSQSPPSARSGQLAVQMIAHSSLVNATISPSSGYVYGNTANPGQTSTITNGFEVVPDTGYEFTNTNQIYFSGWSIEGAPSTQTKTLVNGSIFLTFAETITDGNHTVVGYVRGDGGPVQASISYTPAFSGASSDWQNWSASITSGASAQPNDSNHTGNIRLTYNGSLGDISSLSGATFTMTNNTASDSIATAGTPVEVSTNVWDVPFTISTGGGADPDQTITIFISAGNVTYGPGDLTTSYVLSESGSNYTGSWSAGPNSPNTTAAGGTHSIGTYVLTPDSGYEFQNTGNISITAPSHITSSSTLNGDGTISIVFNDVNTPSSTGTVTINLVVSPVQQVSYGLFLTAMPNVLHVNPTAGQDNTSSLDAAWAGGNVPPGTITWSWSQSNSSRFLLSPSNSNTNIIEYLGPGSGNNTTITVTASNGSQQWSQTARIGGYENSGGM